MINGSIFAISSQNEVFVVWTNNEQEALNAVNQPHIVRKAIGGKPGHLEWDDKRDIFVSDGMNLGDPINLGSNFEVDYDGMAVFKSSDYPGMILPLYKGRPASLTNKLELNAIFQKIKISKEQEILCNKLTEASVRDSQPLPVPDELPLNP